MEKSEILTYPETPPLSGKASKLLVFLHGVGSDGHDLISLVPFLEGDLQDCHFISPHGIEAFDSAPFGRQWFSLADRNIANLKKGLEKASRALSAIISEKQKSLGLENEDTILFGFSQGAMAAIYLTLSAEKPFYATVACSGISVEPEKISNKDTPIFLVHGEEDEVVDVSYLEEAKKSLAGKGIPVKAFRVKNLAHSIDYEVLEKAVYFIKNRR